MRVEHHPILGNETRTASVAIYYNGRKIKAIPGEPIAAALSAAGVKKFRTTQKTHQPRGVFCAIGRCTDCVMTVNGLPNVRTCVTPVKDGMRIETQDGIGKWD